MTALTGLASLIILLVVLVPPLRFVWLDRIFPTGLPGVYRLHHALGLALVGFSFGHAGVAMYPYLDAVQDPGEAFRLFFDPKDLLTLSGSLALLVFSGIAITASLNMARRPWLTIHRLGMFGIGFVAIHIIIAWSYEFDPLSSKADLARLFLGMISVGVLLMLIMHWLRPEWLTKHRRFVVRKVHSPKPGIVDLSLQLGKGRGIWRGGEFGFFQFQCKGPCGVSHEFHPFTALKSNVRNELNLVIKAAGDDTTSLQHITPGTEGKVIGPFGALERLISNASPQLWLAGGLGIMPFYALLQRLNTTERTSQDIVLVYFFRKDKEPLFMDELTQWAESAAWLRLLPLASEPDDNADLESLERLVPDWHGRAIGISGPHAMIEYWRRTMLAHGKRQSHIFTEDFLK